MDILAHRDQAEDALHDQARSRTPTAPRLAAVAGADAALDGLPLIDEPGARFRTDARSASTVSAYQRDWRDFTAWCRAHQLDALPATPATLTLYVADLAARLKVATIGRRLVAISVAHAEAGHATPLADPGARAAWRSVQRRLGVAQTARKALTVADVRSVVAALPETAAGSRDRALILVGFAGALRRAELVGLDVADVALTDEGAVLTVRRSKTDQLGQGRQVGIPRGTSPTTCPVGALAAWLARLGEDDGPIFCSVDRNGKIRRSRLGGSDVARIVKRAVGAVGLPPERYSGHSLRRGLATAAARAGVAPRDIMRQTGHRSLAMVERYVEEGTIFQNNAAASVGL